MKSNEFSEVELHTLSFDVTSLISKTLKGHDKELSIDDNKIVYTFLLNILLKYEKE